MAKKQKLWAVYVATRDKAWELIWQFKAGPFTSEAAAKRDCDALDRKHVVSSFTVRPYDGREVIPVR